MVRSGELHSLHGDQPLADPCDDRCPVPQDDNEGVAALLLGRMLEDSSLKVLGAHP